MCVYTQPDQGITNSSFSGKVSPNLLFNKWQAYDAFEGEKAFKHNSSRLKYLKDIARSVQSVYNDKYNEWHNKYISALVSFGTEKNSFSTQWRLLVDWGENPTLEAGISLHYLYGFPYIPGSAVKGMLHALAEIETMELVESINIFDIEASLADEPPQWLNSFLKKLEIVKILFGSVHLEKGSDSNSDQTFGLKCPKPLLTALQNNLFNKITKDAAQVSEAWKNIHKQISALIEEQTGGMLCFYDAVPEPYQSQLLQPDIVNCHYGDYYKGGPYPSDNQEPNPVVFLTVAPEVEFNFLYRIDAWPQTPGRDDDEDKRLNILHSFTRQSIKEKVESWLKTALGEWGIGAKTTAGYGYFLDNSLPPANNTETTVEMKTQPEIEAIEPEPLSLTGKQLKAGAKINSISKPYNQDIWRRIVENQYIEKVQGEKYSSKAFQFILPFMEIGANGKKLNVFYKNGQFFCQVEIKLRGIKNENEAQYIWEQVIHKQLQDIE